jgi:hypothetical protein
VGGRRASVTGTDRQPETAKFSHKSRRTPVARLPCFSGCLKFLAAFIIYNPIVPERNFCKPVLGTFFRAALSECLKIFQYSLYVLRCCRFAPHPNPERNFCGTACFQAAGEPDRAENNIKERTP